MRNFVQNLWVWLTSRLLLGGLFLFTGVPKIADLNGFAELVIGYGILPEGLSRLAGITLSWVELYLGCSLILGVFVRLGAAVTIPLSLSFMAAGIYAMVKSSGIICGCFGTWVQISHPVSLTIDIITLVLSLALVTQREKDFLTLGQVFKPEFRAQRSKLFNVFLAAIVVLVMAVAAVIIFLLK